MLLQFTVGNFRSFGKPQTLYLSPARKLTGYHAILNTGVFREPEALPCAAVYGANASGKTSLIMALDYFGAIVRSSRSRAKSQRYRDIRFKLNPECKAAPSEFSVTFVAKDKKLYSYALALVPERIVSERLTRIDPQKGSREIVLLSRKDGEKRLHPSVCPNRNFEKAWLAGVNDQETVLAALANKGEVKAFDPVMQWFDGLRPLWPDFVEPLTAELLKSDDLKKKVLVNSMASADIGITDVRIEEKDLDLPAEVREGILKDIAAQAGKDVEEIKSGFKQLETKLAHADTQGNPVWFDLESEESEGTGKYFELLGFLSESLKHGYVLLVDELNRSLHPYLVRKIIQLFTSRETNANGAQLIFSVHDVTVLDKTLLRPDEIYFTEKDETSFETQLYSLADFKEIDSVVKNDRGRQLGKEYLAGRFGAVPNVDWGGGL